MREDMMSRLAEIVKEDVGTECTVHFRKIEKTMAWFFKPLK